MTHRFSSETVLVTGAGRGIGSAVCHHLGAEGAAVVVNDVDAEAAEHVCAELESKGVEALPLVADVTDGTAVEAVFADAAARFGPVTALVNNAGTLCRGRIEEFSDSEWERTLRVNLDSAYQCLKHFTRVRMSAGGGGSVVNIASMSYKGMTQQIAYVASKGGMVSMTRGAAMELARHGIRVNCVAPGMVETRLTAIEHGENDSLRQSMLSRIPLRRYGTPKEIATVTGFLLSSEASYLTGEVLHVAGGARL